MKAPKLWAPRRAAEDTDVLTTHLALPMGVLPVNAFLVHAKEPVLVDTGIPMVADELVAALASCIDLRDLRWIWLTHNDPDHVGALARILDLAPNARVVTTFLGLGKAGMNGPLFPAERAWLLRPGQRLAVGDRELLAVRPPTFDAPESTAVFDLRTRCFFCADSFGVLASTEHEDARAIPARELEEGATAWATIDNPWIHATEERAILDAVAAVDGLGPSRILGAHLPPAPPEMLGTLAAHLVAARSAAPFAGPDQRDMMRTAGVEAA